MRKAIWFGILLWGIVVASFGLGVMNPVDLPQNVNVSAAHSPEGFFLVISGLMVCAMGFISLIKIIRCQSMTDGN